MLLGERESGDASNSSKSNDTDAGSYLAKEQDKTWWILDESSESLCQNHDLQQVEDGNLE